MTPVRINLTRKEYDAALDLGFGRYFKDGRWSLGGVSYEVPVDVAMAILAKVKP